MRRLVCIGLLLSAFSAAADVVRPAGRDSAAILHALNGALSRLADHVSPAVVQIVVSGYGPAREAEGGAAAAVIARQRMVGSGVVVDPAGFIVTNAHVILGADRITVVPPLSSGGWPRDPGGRRTMSYPARVVGIHPETDLAILKIDAQGLPFLRLRDQEPTQGELVFAIGAPQGLASTMTMGIVSSATRQIAIDSPLLFIQTDAPINPGNSGGPLVNADGAVVGINTFILSSSGGSDGLGFAVPAHVVRFVYEGIRDRGSVQRLEIGVGAQGITPELAAGLGLPRDSGVIVSDLEPGGPAEKAGVRRGDMIDSIDGRSVDVLPDLTSMLYRGGDVRLSLRVTRDGVPLELEVYARRREQQLPDTSEIVNPDKHLVSALGISAVDVTEDLKQRLGLREATGAVVVARTLQGPGASNTLSPGDAIHAVNGAEVDSVVALRGALDARPHGRPVVLQIEHDGRYRYVVFDLD